MVFGQRLTFSKRTRPFSHKRMPALLSAPEQHSCSGGLERQPRGEVPGGVRLRKCCGKGQERALASRVVGTLSKCLKDKERKGAMRTPQDSLRLGSLRRLGAEVNRDG